MAIITVDVRNDKEILAAVDKVRSVVKSPNAMSTIHNLMALEAKKWILENFDRDGKLAVPGSGWAALKPNTIVGRRRGKGGASPKILRDSGLLRASVNSKADARQARAGFADRKALFHHAGTKSYPIVPKRAPFLVFMTTSGLVRTKKVKHPGLPARPLIPTRDQIVPLVVKRLDLYVANYLRKLGLKVRTTGHGP